MKRDHFEDLKAVVACLKPNEVRTARKFITAFEGNATKGKNKSLLLFELILKNDELNKEKVEKQLGFPTSPKALEKISDRLKTRILESITLFVNLERNDIYSVTFRTERVVRKQLMAAHFAYARNMLDIALNLFDKIITKSIQFEFYDILIDALNAKRKFLGLTKGQEEYDKISMKVDFYARCQYAVRRSQNWYFLHFSQTQKNGLNQNDWAQLESQVSMIKNDYDFTNSKTVAYYYLSLLMEFYLANESFNKSCAEGKVLISLVEKNIGIFTREQLGGSISDLADNQLYIFDFQESIQNTLMAQKLHKKNNYNFQIALEVQFRATYYSGDLVSSQTLIEELLKSTDKNSIPFHHAKRTYLQACVHFVKAEHKEAQQLLHSTKEIENDKEGWNIGKRLLTILIHLEQDDWDQAETAITNLRMHIQRLKPEGTVRKRDAVILKVLQKLLLASFDYQQVLDKHPELFEQLDRTERDYRWQVKSPEMVVFHHWFQDKAQGIPYQFRVPEPLIKKFGAKSPGRDLDFPVKYP